MRFRLNRLGSETVPLPKPSVIVPEGTASAKKLGSLLWLGPRQRLRGGLFAMQTVVDLAQGLSVESQCAAPDRKTERRAKDLLALIFWDGSGWKEPRKDRRNGL
jgi:hypothetical protein